MKVVLESNRLADDYDYALQAQRMETIMAGGFYLAVFVEDRDGVPYEVRAKLSVPDAVAAYAAGRMPMSYFAGVDVRQLVEDFEASGGETLGALSRTYESNGDAGAHGYDRNGGHSYGAYQFSSRQGSLDAFLVFLATAAPTMAATLSGAGGAAAAKRGEAAFIAAWKALGAEPAFFRLQHSYVRRVFYDVFARRLKDMGLDIARRSLAVRNAAWSTAVQHGPGTDLWRTALGRDPQGTDAEILRKVYAERARVEVYFKSSTPAVQAAVRARFKRELADALAMLA